VRGDEPADDVDRIIQLERLLELAVLAVPTCIGVSLILRGRAPAVTHSALRTGWHAEPVRSSLSVRLPRPLTASDADGGAELRVYAGGRHAFADAVPSLLALLDIASRQIVVDAHLKLPDLVDERATLDRWRDEQAVVDRAVGILLDRGLVPDEGHLELVRLADVSGTSTLEAARALIASATNGPGSA
jgi:hypothetical protein